MRRTNMEDPNNDILNIAAKIRKSIEPLNDDDEYEITVSELSNAVNDVIFDALKEGRDAVDILRALNELGNILVSQTQDYDEFKE